MTIFVVGAILAGTPQAFASPPIFQPGAPGLPSRTVTPEQSISLAGTGHSAADVRFMQHMIVHHGQAVEMGELIAGRTDNPDVALMGARIASSQASEIEMMQAWLERRGLSTRMAHASAMAASGQGHGNHAMEPGMDHAAHGVPSDTPLMPGMLSPAQMVQLEAARGDQFDRLYLAGMIHHHQGAIDMVTDLLAGPGNGEDPQLSEFLSAVIADQSAEISRMRGMLADL
ncbi:DUF305 domain-containing protein [Maricaulis sp.]|uniref:DUF305 domain-containing protein n=1 Tax=Maricaulis sp. TaxID=1486257 RepID=UPI002B275F02|nr:DUF305 domain-containing protein [Maricaulis sp.]